MYLYIRSPRTRGLASCLQPPVSRLDRDSWKSSGQRPGGGKLDEAEGHQLHPDPRLFLGAGHRASTYLPPADKSRSRRILKMINATVILPTFQSAQTFGTKATSWPAQVRQQPLRLCHSTCRLPTRGPVQRFAVDARSDLLQRRRLPGLPTPHGLRELRARGVYKLVEESGCVQCGGDGADRDPDRLLAAV